MFNMVRAGVCVVQRPDGGTLRDLLVSVRRRHGRCPGTPASGHVGQLPALPEP